MFILEPLFMAMTAGYVVAASTQAFYTWNYKSTRKFNATELSQTIQRKRDGTEK